MQQGYHKQDGCWNCRLCFILKDHFGTPWQWHCLASAPLRPPCGWDEEDAGGLGHTHGPGSMWRCVNQAWNRWQRAVDEVSRNAICNRWTPGAKSPERTWVRTNFMEMQHGYKEGW